MKHRLEREVHEWLNAQREGSDELAEEALLRAFAQLGRRGPRAGFADRVLVRAGRLAPLSPVWRWWVRGAVAACLLAAGLAMATLPAWLPVARPVAHALGVPVLSVLSHWFGAWMTGAVAAWKVVEDVVGAVRASLATPTAFLVLAANVLLAAASLLGLKRLLKAPEELTSW